MYRYKKISLLFGLIMMSVLIVVMTSRSISENRVDKEDKKKVITDYGMVEHLDDVFTPRLATSNFIIELEKGRYQEGDILYVFKKGTKMFYSKYILQKDDVEGLLFDELTLKLRSLAGVDAFKEDMRYIIVSKEDVEDFEKNMIVSGEFKLLEPKLYIVEHSVPNTFDIVLLQSQKYQEGDTLTIRSKENILETRILTKEDVSTLHRQFATFSFDLSESGIQDDQLTIKLHDQSGVEKINYSFSVTHKTNYED